MFYLHDEIVEPDTLVRQNKDVVMRLVVGVANLIMPLSCSMSILYDNSRLYCMLYDHVYADDDMDNDVWASNDMGNDKAWGSLQ